MRYTKQLLTFFILFLFAAAEMAIAATSITVENSSGTVGEQIDVPITVSNPTNIAGASFTVTYDTSALELNQLNSEFFPYFSDMGIPDANPVYVDEVPYYRAMDGSEFPEMGSMIAAARTTTGESNTTLFILRFTILPGATAPSYDINIEPSVISNTDAGYDSQGEEIPMLISINGDEYPEEPVTGISGGTITVNDGSPGDTDGDGIPDQWERDNAPVGVDPNSQEALDVYSATGDYDHDGYSDLQENINGYDPQIPDPPGGPGYEVNTDGPAKTDFNGNGTSDILWRHSTTGKLYVYLMDGSTRVQAASPSTLADFNWVIKGKGDFDGDGKSDILWHNNLTGQVYIWFMNGTSRTSSSGVATISDLNWQIKGTDDFNGDGKADILWRHAISGKVYVYLMDGAEFQAASPSTLDDLNWVIKDIGDFNKDGKADILWRHDLTGQIYIWCMSGTSLDSSSSVGLVSDLQWQIVGTGDFNGDGSSDILWRHATTGKTYIYLMEDCSRVQHGSPGTVSDSSWTIKDVGDYDGDGKDDILWSNSTTGQIYMWFMNGTVLSISSSAGTISDQEWQIK